MGGQACVFYGAAQFSKDIDFLLLADEGNFRGLHAALHELGAERIAVPKFDPAVLDRGHEVHFRCQVGDAKGLRIDIMTRLRDLPDFRVLWERRTTIATDDGTQLHLLSLTDLVRANKTQCSKHWPVIEALVTLHHLENESQPRPDWIAFWLMETRTPERLIELIARFPDEANTLVSQRPLLALAIDQNRPKLREALDAEVRAEQEKDRIYWEPLKREMEAFRREERWATDPT